MTQRDYNSALNLARAEGKEEGREEGRAEGKEEGLQEGIAQGEAKGREEGITQGEAKARLATAKALKSKGISPDVIAECTGLSQDRISAL